MALSDTEIRNAKPDDKPKRLWDAGGLYLEVSPTGGRWWRFKFRFAGKEKRLSLGTYPETGLKAARAKRDAARKLLDEGVDPSAARRAHKAAGAELAANSFEVVAREWLETKRREWVPEHAAKVERWLVVHVFPHIGRDPVASIEAPIVLAMLRRMVKRGTLNTAGRVRETVGAVFRYAISTGRGTRDPSADLRDALPTATPKHFASITDPGDVAELLRAIDGYQGEPGTCAALRLAPILFQRPGELRGAEWEEIDLDAGEWRIPAARQKIKKADKENPRTPPHIVPLPTQAVAILRELHALTGRGRLLFPGLRTPSRPISENTINAALRWMGYAKEQMTGHGFRHMASTRLNELGWNPDAIERQLSHRDRNTIRGTYNQAQYLDERRRMMQAWADYLDGLQAGGNVIAIRRAG